MSYMEYLEQVIDNKINFSNSKYMVYTKEREIIEYSSIPEKVDYISINAYENLILESAKGVIEKFASTSDNKDVYVLYLFIDTEGSCNGLSINTLSSYQNRIKNLYPDLDENDKNSILGVKYSEGDASYRFYNDDFNTEAMKEVSGAYYAINCDHPIISLKRDVAFDKNLFESRVVTAGINALNRLKENFEQLHRAEDFICTVCLHDVSINIEKKLLEKSNDIRLLQDIFTEFRE